MRSAEPALVGDGAADGVPVGVGDPAAYTQPRPSGRPDPFSAFFETHHPPVSAYLRRRAPHDVADELAVATFEVAWQRWSDIPAERPLPWLYGVARRLLANHRRGDRRWGRLRSRLSAGRSGRALPAPGPEGADDPAAAAVDALVARQALARLRADDREALMLVAWEGLDAASAAASLGITRGAFAVRLHRARQRLEKLLPPETTAEDPT